MASLQISPRGVRIFWASLPERPYWSLLRIFYSAPDPCFPTQIKVGMVWSRFNKGEIQILEQWELFENVKSKKVHLKMFGDPTKNSEQPSIWCWHHIQRDLFFDGWVFPNPCHKIFTFATLAFQFSELFWLISVVANRSALNTLGKDPKFSRGAYRRPER